MSKELLSIIVYCWHEPQQSAMQLQVVRADTAEEVHLSDGSFLLRLFTAEGVSPERGLIRHLASGREVYLQSGPNLRDFITACLLKKGDEKEPPDTPPSGG